MAELNMKYYTNLDTYSDGDIENDILEIVEGKKHISDFYGEYAVLYHLSPIRENIINWYPFNSNKNCLEIGAGCGAITGALCHKLKKVISVDISKRRSEINYKRHKDCDNLEIIVGNIHEIEFEEKFDYIILNGVFEYAMSFTHTDKNPYTEFLSFVKKLLNKNGCIIIAIENRLGLKYFTGAAEDHTGEYFLGLNNYVNNNTVRTFSKSEIIDIVKECGFNYYKFYYPYPDYKFPSEIFTDETIKEFKYGRPYFNLNNKTLELCSEDRLAKSLSGENVIDSFANSFFIEIRNRDDFSDVIYAKLNSERNENFRIATVITENNSKRLVKKYPLTHKAEKHISNIYENAKYEPVRSVKNGKVSKNHSGISYTYYSCSNMDDVVTEYIKLGKAEEIVKLISDFYEPFIAKAYVTDFYNKDFKKVFGNKVCNKELYCIKPANIDMICDNIMLTDEGYVLIDTEWIFNFDVPVLFILWRTIRELYAKHNELSDYLTYEEMLEKFGIDAEMDNIFVDWALHFVNDYVGNNVTEKFAVEKKNISLNNVFNLNFNETESSLYINNGDGYSEDNKIVKTLISNNNGNFCIKYSLPENVTEFRWDPVEKRCCKCKIEYINGEIISSNGVKESEYYVFDNGDPQFIILTNSNILEIKGTIFIDNIESSADNYIQQLINLKGEINNKDFELSERDKEIELLNVEKIKLIDYTVKLNDRIAVSQKSQAYLTNQISLLNSQIKAEKLKYDEIINSKGWRFMDKLRKILILFRR